MMQHLSKRSSGQKSFRALALQAIAPGARATRKPVLLSVNVLNYRNDTTSSGVNSQEVSLTPTNVKTGFVRQALHHRR